MKNNKIVKKRNLFVGFIFSVITLGIYITYWFVQTKKEMNELGGKIPTSWLLIVPFVNLYWMFKYCEAFGNIIKKNNNGVLYFILGILFFQHFQ